MWLGTMSLARRMPRAPGAVAQVRVGGLAAEVVGDPVVVERVGRRDGVRVAAHPLDPLRGDRALPQPDEPQPGDAPARERSRAPRRGSRRASGCRGRSGATAGRARHTCSSPSARRRGIQAESTENASGSSASRRRMTGASRSAPARRTAATEAQMQGRAPPRRGCRSRGPAGRSARRGRRRGSPPSARGCSAAGRPARSGRGGPAAA